MAERIARIIGLDICGIDIATPASIRPCAPTAGAVLEVNAAPGLRMHLAPSEGSRATWPRPSSTCFSRWRKDLASR
jgi:cyanophycin synthetase